MTWLVTGGAGYIGAHLVRTLSEKGAGVVVLDDLSTGVESRLPAGVPLVTGSLLDERALATVFEDHAITGVVHMAAKKRVDESLEEPLWYYRENVEGLRQLLHHCAAAGVKNFLFSSSAAVYGDTGTGPIDEDTPCAPMNPYGQTKLAGEWLTHAVGDAAGIRTVALRYFNVAGAASAELADQHATNLVPIVLTAINQGESPTIFGDDYPTPDGTCIRDYIHVSDVADAHVAAMQALEEDTLPSACTLNIGTGRGASVAEIVDVALRVTGGTVSPVVGPRRPGDPSAVIAEVGRSTRLLQWKAGRDVTEMVASAWSAMRPVR